MLETISLREQLHYYSTTQLTLMASGSGLNHEMSEIRSKIEHEANKDKEDIKRYVYDNENKTFVVSEPPKRGRMSAEEYRRHMSSGGMFGINFTPVGV